MYPDIDDWPDQRLISTYRRLSRDLRQRGYDDETVTRMCRVEEHLRAREIDPGEIARQAQAAVK